MQKRYRNHVVGLIFLVLTTTASVPSAALAHDASASQSDDSLDELSSQAMAALMRGDLESARTLARQSCALALKLHGQDSDEYQNALKTLAVVNLTSGDNASAMELSGANDGATANSPSLEEQFGRVSLLQSKGNISQALSVLHAMEPRLRAEQDKAIYYELLGDLLGDTRDFVGAGEAYGKSASNWLAGSDPTESSALEMLAKKALATRRLGREEEASKQFDDVFARVEAYRKRQIQTLESLIPPAERQTSEVRRSIASMDAGLGQFAAIFEAGGRGAQVTGWRRRERDARDALMNGSDYQVFDDTELVANLLGQAGKESEALQEVRAQAVRARGFGRSGGQDGAGRNRDGVRRDSASPIFVTLADADYAFGHAFPSDTQDVRGEAFEALQEAVNGPASRALLGALADKRLGPQAVKRRALSVQSDQLDVQIAATFAAGNGEGANALIEQQKGIDSQIDGLDEQIATLAPDYYVLVNPAPMSRAAIQAILRPDEAVLLIVPGARGTHVMAISRQGQSWNKAALDDQKIATAVDQLRRSLDPRFRPTNLATGWAFDRKVAYRLYQDLVEPVAAILAGKHHLFVVSSGAMSRLPLGVLVTREPTGDDADPAALRATAWLADEYALSQLPSVQSLAALRHGNAASPHQLRRTMIGFGDPMLNGRAVLRGGSDEVRGVSLETLVASPAVDATSPRVANVALLQHLARLPGTAGELTQLRDLVGVSQSRLYLQAEATESAVKHTDLSNLHILAFATHGLPGGTVGPTEPGLVLTPPAHASEQEDGLLTASEIVGLNLDVDWAILSACDTAGGEDSAALSSLSRAFLAGGAETLLVSHWPVFDSVAGELTTRTFRDMQANAQITRAEALQSAMREVRTMPAHPEFAHPGYWAPFVLIGDGSRQ